MSIKTIKHFSSDPGKYLETVEFQVLHCSNVIGNNNKFYALELQKIPNQEAYQLFSHYGRLGQSETYDIRNDNNGNTLSYSEAKKEYDSIIKSKKKGKTVEKDGQKYNECYVPVEVVSSNVGSYNIRKQPAVLKATSSLTSFSSYHRNSNVNNLLKKLVSDNIHHITSVSNIHVSVNGGLETPLGPVTANHVATAKLVLDDLCSLFGPEEARVAESEAVAKLNTQYLSLVPRKLGKKIMTSDWILTSEQLHQEYDLLGQLASAVTVQSATSEDVSFLDATGLSIELVENLSVIKKLASWYEKTKSKNHHQCRDWKVSSVYDVTLKKERSRFEASKSRYGRIETLFHGSRNTNILSILTSGLIVPPASAPHVTGRMFGNGIYAASCSTKALNYSIGYWNGSRAESKAYMFVVNFAMGNVYETYQSCNRGAPSGYHSTHAKAGQSLLNDEYIVYSTEQATVTHLLELTQN